MNFDVRALPADQLAEFLYPTFTAMGIALPPERLAQIALLPELTLRLSAFVDGRIVGSAGAHALSLTVPGNVQVDTAGITVVGVLPTHRRRGILSRLMREHLYEAHRQGKPLAALFASEGSIYRQFGFNMASLGIEIEIDRAFATFVADAPRMTVTARLVDEDEAAATFPAVWDRVRLRTPGMMARSPAWWRVRRIGDPAWARSGRMPLQRVLLEQDGHAVAYAVYRPLDGGFDQFNINTMSVEVTEALGDGPAATAAIWRYLFDLDLARHIKARLLPVDHPLLFLLTEARRLRMRASDALWVRPVDVGAALSARRYEPGPPLTLDISDPFCPWNTGTWRLADGSAQRTDAAPELKLSIDALGAVYLGGFRCSQLAAAGRMIELVPGALRRADLLFATNQAPWAPEIF